MSVDMVISFTIIQLTAIDVVHVLHVHTPPLRSFNLFVLPLSFSDKPNTQNDDKINGVKFHTNKLIIEIGLNFIEANSCSSLDFL